MNRFQAAILIYGLIMILMALQAFFFPQGQASPISLIAGGSVGLIEIGFAALSKTNPRVGFMGAAIVTLLPLGRFIPTLVKDGSLVIYPALVGVVLSVGLALFLVGGHLAAKRRARHTHANPPAAS